MAFGLPPSARTPTSAPDPRGVFEGAAEHLRRGARHPRRALPRREVPTRRSSPAASPADPGAARTGPRGAGGRKVHVPDGLAAAAAASSAAGGTTNTHHKYTPARLSPLCRGGLFGPTGRATLGAPDVSAGVCSGGLGRPSTSHTVLVVNQDPPSSARCLCRTSSGRLLCRAGQRGWRRGTRGRSVKPLWAPTRFKWRVGPSQTRCVPPRVHHLILYARSAVPPVSRASAWSPGESSSSACGVPPWRSSSLSSVFTWRSGEFRQSVLSLLVSLLVLRYIVEICISFVQIENSVQEDV